MFVMRDYISESIQTKEKILFDSSIQEIILNVALRMVSSIRSGHKILVAGNGGSATDAQHLAGELVSKFF